MKGLLLKDLYNMKSIIRYYVCIPFVIAAVCYVNQSLSTMLFLPAFMSVLFVMSAFAYDEMSSFQEYALTLPLIRKNLVSSKYMLAVLALISMYVFISILILAMIMVFHDVFANVLISEMVMMSLLSAIAILFVLAIQLPCIFYFGNEKARIVFFIVVLLMGLGGGLLMQMMKTTFMNFFIWANSHLLVFASSAIIITVIVFIVSYFISVKIMQKKTF